MNHAANRSFTWLSGLLLAGALAACGGGGGGGASTPPDARNGDYTLFAADTRQYTLSLDFNAGTYRIAGNGTDERGAFAADGAGFAFTPSGTPPAVNNAKFSLAGDTVVGAARLAGNVTPFIASRTFVTTVADAAGPYKLLSVTLDPPAAPVMEIFTGEIVAPNVYRYCADAVVYRIQDCPAASIMAATLTSNGTDFLADFGAPGTISFRVARVGSDKVFVRASPSSGTSRKFQVGFDQNGGYPDVTFNGVNNAGQSTRTSVTATALSSTLTSESNASTTRSGAVNLAGPAGLLAVTTAADGNFFTMRTADLTVVFAARNNPVHPGYVEIGRN